MKIGTTDIKKLFLGNNEILKAFLGNSKIYEKQSEEWILVLDKPEGYTKRCGTSDTTFGDTIYWENGVKYRYVFDWEITELTNGTQISLRDANTQSVNFVSGKTHHLGDKGHADSIINSNRERNRQILILKYYDNQYTIKVTNLKLYKHV